MSNILPVPVPKDIALYLNERDGKVIETATLAAGSIQNKVIDSTNTVSGAALVAASVTLAKLSAGVSPSHVVKFVRTGSTSATLTGVAVGDIVISILAAGSVAVALVASVNTLPSAPLIDTYTIVLRAAA